MAKNFLNEEQVEVLESKDWTVKPKGFRITLFAKEHNHGVWKQMCKIAGVPSSVSEFTTVSFGVIAK